MDLEALSSIESFTGTVLIITAAVCLAAVFVAWYTVRTRIRWSQVILGIFSYLLVMILENVIGSVCSSMNIQETGMSYAIYLILSVVISREIIRFAVIQFGLCPRFSDTDSAVGLGIGMAGFYLLICCAYYFNCYSAVEAYLSDPTEFFLSSGSDSQEAYNLLLAIAGQDSWEFIFTALNRVFYLVREISLCVLAWYGLTSGKMRRCLFLVPILHLICVIPDSLYAADLFDNSYISNILTCLLSAGTAAIAAFTYNRTEDQAAHYEFEKLKARRRR